MTTPLQATIIVNRAARGVRPGFNPTRIARYLRKLGHEARLIEPTSAADATREARAAAERGDHLVFAIGGDGTVRDVAKGLAGSETALAAVPAGTVNIWAKEAGIPNGIRASIDTHLAGQSVHMDLGRAGEECFLLMAGIGWDAAITSRVSSRLKKVAGDIAYIAQGAIMAPSLRPTAARWTADGEAHERALAWMVLGNTRLYGGKVRLTAEAVIDDGQLDGIAFFPTNVGETLRLAGKVALGKLDDPRLSTFRAESVSIETPGLPVQLDGDHIGETPMQFTVERAGLLVSVPAGPLKPIFGGPHSNRRPNP